MKIPRDSRVDLEEEENVYRCRERFRKTFIHEVSWIRAWAAAQRIGPTYYGNVPHEVCSGTFRAMLSNRRERGDTIFFE